MSDFYQRGDRGLCSHRAPRVDTIALRLEKHSAETPLTIVAAPPYCEPENRKAPDMLQDMKTAPPSTTSLYAGTRKSRATENID